MRGSRPVAGVSSVGLHDRPRYLVAPSFAELRPTYVDTPCISRAHQALYTRRDDENAFRRFRRQRVPGLSGAALSQRRP